MIHENYKLFVNPLFKTNWFCTYLLMDLNTVENYVRSNHSRIFNDGSKGSHTEAAALLLRARATVY